MTGEREEREIKGDNNMVGKRAAQDKRWGCIRRIVRLEANRQGKECTMLQSYEMIALRFQV